MNINAVSALLPSWTQVNSTANRTATSNTTRAASASQPAGTADISPSARFLSWLQQLQQQNPDQFKLVASGLASRLQKEAQRAQASGDTTQAGQLNQLASEFQKSAETGELPSAQDLQAAGFGAHYHHSPFQKGLLSTAGLGGRLTPEAS